MCVYIIMTIRVTLQTLSLDEFSGTLVVKTWKPNDSNEVAGELSVKFGTNRPNHCILLASRFNRNSVEPNSPFPGWFLQLVGSTVSLAWGDGRTWHSVRTGGIENNKEYHIAFRLSNSTKRAELYLNGKLTLKENIQFKPPCDTVVIGGLSPDGNQQFRFVGEMNNVKLGSSVEVVEEDKEKQEEDEKEEEMPDISHCKEHIAHLHGNIQNINHDIASLQTILAQIESWKLRGIDIDTTSLEQQIESLEKELATFYASFQKDYDALKAIDDQIRVEPNDMKSDNVLDMYECVICNLLTDIDILDNAVRDLSKFKDMGVKLGSAFESISEQKEMIKSTLLQCETILGRYVQQMTKTMNEVQ